MAQKTRTPYVPPSDEVRMTFTIAYECKIDKSSYLLKYIATKA